MHIAFHPKAFMANFVFNTNVWASKDKSLQVAGTGLFNNRELFPFYYPANSRCVWGGRDRGCSSVLEQSRLHGQATQHMQATEYGLRGMVTVLCVGCVCVCVSIWQSPACAAYVRSARPRGIWGQGVFSPQRAPGPWLWLAWPDLPLCLLGGTRPQQCLLSTALTHPRSFIHSTILCFLQVVPAVCNIRHPRVGPTLGALPPRAAKVPGRAPLPLPGVGRVWAAPGGGAAVCGQEDYRL